MSTEEFRLKFTADMDELKKKLRAGTISTKEFAAAAKKLQQEFKVAKDGAEEAAKQIAGAMKGIEGLGRSIGGPLGELTGLLGDLGDTSEGLSAAFGELGAIGAVAGVSLAAMGLAAAGAVGSLYALEGAAIDAQAALVLPSETTDQVELLADRMGAASEATNRLAVEAGIAADVLGSETIDTVTGATLALADSAETIGGWIGAVVQAEKASTKFAYTLLAWPVLFADFAQAAVTGKSYVLDAMESTGEALDDTRERGAALTAQMGEHRKQAADVAKMERLRADAERELARDLRLREQGERKAAAATKTGSDTNREAEASARALADAYREIAEATGTADDKQTSAYDARISQAEDLDKMGMQQEAQALRSAAASGMAAEQSKSLADSERDRAFAVMEGWTKTADLVAGQLGPMFDEIEANLATGVQNAEEYRDAASSVGREVIDSAGSVAGDLMSMAKEGSTAYRIMFAAQKAAAIAGITVDTAKAVTSALTIPPPFGEIAAASRIAVGAAQVASVVATSIGGGAQMPIGGVAPDHTGGIVAPGEGVLTRQTVARIGGKAGIDKLNTGGAGGGGTTVVQLRYGSRALETVAVDAMARPGGMRRGIRSLTGRRDSVAGHRG